MQRLHIVPFMKQCMVLQNLLQKSDVPYNIGAEIVGMPPEMVYLPSLGGTGHTLFDPMQFHEIQKSKFFAVRA